MNSITHTTFINQPSRKHSGDLDISGINHTFKTRLKSNSFNLRSQFNNNQIKLYLHSLI